MGMNYSEFLDLKTQMSGEFGFNPIWMPDFLYDFQKELLEWVLLKGRGAIFADCGLGKTPMQLVWAENVLRKTNKRVLILTPLAVGSQTIREGEKFGIECRRSRNGEINGSGIYITNYEQLHKFNPEDFIGVVCDESSILKHFSGSTQKAITRFMLKMPYRSLWTATASPNDYTELGTSSEALGFIGYSDMITRFFKMEDKKRTMINDVKLYRASKNGIGNYYQKLSYRVAQQIGQYRLKGHAEVPFWRWVASWAKAIRKPSDLGYKDDKFILPDLVEKDHVIMPDSPPDGELFTVRAVGFHAERQERKRTLNQRCEFVADLVNHKKPAIVWCHYNQEGEMLSNIIKEGVEVSGSTNDTKKEEIYDAFQKGEIRVLITKPKIGGWGMNWQHCSHVVSFATHSYEQDYQSIRRCYRFGQKEQVVVDRVCTEGEKHVLDNMKRKAEAMNIMFERLIEHMNNAVDIKRNNYSEIKNIPTWLS